MLTKVQEKQVQGMLDDLNSLMIKSHILQSQSLKGVQLDESDNELAQAAEDLRAEQLEIAEGLADMFKSDDMKRIADKIKGYKLTPENLVECLEQIAKDMADLYAKAFKLMLENMKRRERQEKAEKDAERSNEQEKLRHMQSKVGEYDKQKAEKWLGEFQKGLTSSPEMVSKKRGLLGLGLLGLGDGQRSVLNKTLHAGLMTAAAEKSRQNPLQRQVFGNKKAPLIYAKSSDAKEMDRQRALKKHEMTLMKGVPAMAPSQMSRG